MHGTVLTSATLTVDGSFDYVRGRLGLASAPARSGSTRSSTTRASRSSTCPRNMPDPRSPDFVSAAAGEVIEILKRTHGRAFVLFTSYANLREVHRDRGRGARIPDVRPGQRAAVGAAAGLQGDTERRPARHVELLAGRGRRRRRPELRDHRQAAVRVARRSDHRGPDRSHRRAGGSAFGDYQMPLAILALKQGLGRLLRHRQDRGVLAVLDPRLRTMGYGRRFLASLPPAPVTHELIDIARFFRDRCRRRRLTRLAKRRARAVRPILKWAGGKRQLLPALRPYYPPPSPATSSRFSAAAPCSSTATTAACSTGARSGCPTSTPTSSAATAWCATPSEAVDRGAAAARRRASRRRRASTSTRSATSGSTAIGGTSRRSADPAAAYTPSWRRC